MFIPLVIITFIILAGLSILLVYYSKKTPPPNPSSHIASSPNYHNELIRSDFVPAEPNHYWCDLGQTYLKHHNYQDAIDSFNKALEVEKESLHQAEVLYFLGASYLYNDNPSQAKTSFQNSITLYESVIDKLPASEQEVIKTRLAELYKVTGRNNKENE